jgi:hypothetical protein
MMKRHLDRESPIVQADEFFEQQRILLHVLTDGDDRQRTFFQLSQANWP